jgi:hypothetical protein
MNGELPYREAMFGSKFPDVAENPTHRGDRRRKPQKMELHREDHD